MPLKVCNLYSAARLCLNGQAFHSDCLTKRVCVCVRSSVNKSSLFYLFYIYTNITLRVYVVLVYLFDCVTGIIEQLSASVSKRQTTCALRVLLKPILVKCYCLCFCSAYSYMVIVPDHQQVIRQDSCSSICIRRNNILNVHVLVQTCACPGKILPNRAQGYEMHTIRCECEDKV